MSSARLLVLVGWAAGCDVCGDWTDAPIISGRAEILTPSGVTSPVAKVSVRGHRVVDGYRSGDQCEYTTEPLRGTATVSPDGAATLSLIDEGDEFVGPAPYARTYRLALRESSGDEHIETLRMPDLFTIKLVPGPPLTREFPKDPDAWVINDAASSPLILDYTVGGVLDGASLAVAVDITHPYRGDLVLELRKDNVVVKTLVQNVGGSTDNINETFTLTSAELGTSLNVPWQVRVYDTKAGDAGSVNALTLIFTQPQTVDGVSVETSRPLLADESALVSVMSCTTRQSYASFTANPAGWTINAGTAAVVGVGGNYRVSVRRAYSDTPSSALTVFADYVVPNGTACD